MGAAKTSKSRKTSPETNSSKKRPRKHAKLWKWTGRGLIGLMLLIFLVGVWFRLSPWPGAMLVRAVFNHNDLAKAQRAYEPHDVATIYNQQYADDKSAKLDVHMPANIKASDQKLPVIIWTHGGAWLSGDKADWAPYFKLIAQAGYVVVAPNYSLAPQKAYPTAIHQLNAAHAYVQENAERFHADTSKVILAGDSAGSQLSAQLGALITNPDYAREVGIQPNLKPEQLKGMVLNCGIYKMGDLAHPAPNLPKIIGWGDDVTVWAYSGTHDFSSPIIRQMSPYYHVTKDFPAAFITGGNADPLTDSQSKPFANELQRLGVNVTPLFYEQNHTPALPHEYQFNLDTHDGQRALDLILNFIRSQTER